MSDVADILLDSLPLSPRLQAILSHYGLMTLADVSRVSERELKMLPGVGKLYIGQLTDALARHGLSLEAKPEKRPLPLVTLHDLQALLNFHTARLYEITARLDAIERNLREIRQSE